MLAHDVFLVKLAENVIVFWCVFIEWEREDFLHLIQLSIECILRESHLYTGCVHSMRSRWSITTGWVRTFDAFPPGPGALLLAQAAEGWLAGFTLSAAFSQHERT
jgi:hypothetical protein